MGKIDLHFHDIKTKNDNSGDVTRDITNKEISSLIKKYDIQMLAIVNHLTINKKKFLDLYKLMEDEENFILLIGFEINIYRTDCHKKGDYWHILLISDKNEINKMEEIINSINGEKYNRKITEDEFVIILSKSGISEDECIIIPHFSKGSKKRNAPFNLGGGIVDYDLFDKFKKKFSKYLILNETNTLQKLNREYSNGIKSIVGSDAMSIKDFEENKVSKLIELMINFESIKKFILFMSKDSLTIKEIINNRNKEEKISPLKIILKNRNKNDEKIEFKYRRGINLLFGKRGSGKSVILDSLKEHLNESDYEYYSGSEKIKDGYKDFHLKICKEKMIFPEEGKFYKIFEENDSLFSYKNKFARMKKYYESEEKMNLSKLTRFARTDSDNMQALFSSDKFKTELNDIFKKNINLENINKEILTNEYISMISKVNKVYLLKIKKEYTIMVKEILNIKYKKLLMKESKVITKLVFLEIRNLTNLMGEPNKPSLDFSENKIKTIDKYILFIEMKKNINKKTKNNLEIFKNKQSFGEFKLLVSWKYLSNKKEDYNIMKENINKILAKKEDKKDFFDFMLSKSFFDFEEWIYKTSWKKVLSPIGEQIKKKGTIFIIGFEVDSFVKENKKTLSKGQEIEILFSEVLNSKKKFLILDEVDYSLDADYINKTLVKKLNEIELEKTIFLATHSANLAVNSIPINWIYRKENDEKENKYTTYTGTIYENILKNIDNEKDFVKWDETVIKVMEGGTEALKRRGYIYGK